MLKTVFLLITSFLLELATKNVLTIDKKLTIPQILIPSITLYLVSFNRYRTFPTSFPTIRNFKLSGRGGTPSKQRTIKKNYFLTVTKISPDETSSIFNFKKGEIMKHPIAHSTALI